MSIKLIPTEDFDALINVVSGAYTAFDYHIPSNQSVLKERLLHIQNEDPTISLYGYYKNEKLVGSMRFHDYEIHLHNQKLKAGGIGLVAVDLLNKKEKIAKEMLIYFLKHYQEKGATVAMLYPFRPDFYKKMGFGFGTKMNLYKIKPENFPSRGSKHNIKYLTEKDKEKLLECYNEYCLLTNGLLNKTQSELEAIFKNPANRIIGCEIDGKILGYCIFNFQKGEGTSFLINDIQVKELVYLDTKSLNEIFTFFNSQSDQVRYIVINTQDEDFYHLFSDPRNDTNHLIPFVYHESNTSGVGIMYRVLDVMRAFQSLGKKIDHNVNKIIRWNIFDSLLEENNKSIITEIKDGRLELIEKGSFELEINIDITNLSSLYVGSISFSKLINLGLAEISDKTVIPLVETIFKATKPLCMSGF
ncbi:GNAT family N-acetyltransferase [Fictibacillus sp. BK138]|uniref:GNAT family N-acetyltransferase n=1 Tax=Fictibacillus sp. BK138 TaxID=2512121 RepID=UPI00102A7532|nr:GNAT family N-acetyltransferase [Fictibacillus sp. BK138]RZT15491.1 putative acetyltransferase [Fictibacillus sp. BK138]